MQGLREERRSQRVKQGGIGEGESSEVGRGREESRGSIMVEREWSGGVLVTESAVCLRLSIHAFMAAYNPKIPEGLTCWLY